MEKSKTIRAGWKEYSLYAVNGYVASVNKVVKTHVYGGGGNASVSSSNTVDTHIFLIDNEGKEQSFNLKEWDIVCREGNELTVAWVLPKGVSSSNIGKRKYVYVENHSTNLFWDDIDKLPRSFFSWAIIGIFFLFGIFGNFFITHNIFNAITSGIVFALFGLVVVWIIGFILYIKSKVVNESKHIRSEFYKGIGEIIRGESSTPRLELTPSTKIVTAVLVSCLLLAGYWGFMNAGDIFQSLGPSLNSPNTQTVTVSPTSIQRTIDSLEFVSIPAGEFDMGSPSNEVGRYKTEGPIHQVKFSKSFYMGKYEVTQKQWFDVMGSNPSNFKGDNLPVENIAWNDIQDFIKKLNDKEGGSKYRLPSEAEWEYAARAGTKTSYFFGDDDSKLGDYAWYRENSGGKTHEVGQKKPNPWGLYDIYGNVEEWVEDTWNVGVWDDGGYEGAPTDGSSWEIRNENSRVQRGSNYAYTALDSRSAFRSYSVDNWLDDAGFRLVRVS